MSTSPSESETTPEEYRQRALLMADLGRYDEAAGDIAAGLAAAPADAALLATLARVHLAADQPAEALVAAERAVQAGPGEINTLVVRAMALVDVRRYGDAAVVATDILRRWPEDAYAQRTGAALLSESRNGQDALNAAWNSVRVAPAEPESHLVLAVVAARLRLFDLAQRAYAEALDLDEAIGDAQSDVGIVRLERRRWARALELLADEAALGTVNPPGSPAADSRSSTDPRLPSDPAADSRPTSYPVSGSPSSAPEAPSTSDPSSGRDPSSGSGSSERNPSSGIDPLSGSGPSSGADPEFPRAYPAPDRRKPAKDAFDPTVAARGDVWNEPPSIARPNAPVLDPSGDSADGIRQAVLYSANGVLVAALLTALMATTSGGASRVWAGLIGVIIFAAVLIWLSRRLHEPTASALTRLRSVDRRLAGAAYLAFSAPVLILVYAFVGGLIPLVAAMVVAGVAEILVLTRR